VLTEPAPGGATVAASDARTATGWLVRRAAVVYLAIAVVLTAIGALALRLPDAHPTVDFDGSTIVGGWCRFDCGWYVDIADHGYSYVRGEQSSVAFFPGYPLVARAVSGAIDNTPLALIVVTWVAGLAAMMLFAHWCARRLGRTAAVLAVACFALYPYAWYRYGAGYADALFLACAIGAFVLLEHDQPLLAGLAGAAAGATRPIGVAVAVGLLARAIERRGGLPMRQGSGARTIAGRLGIPARLDVRVLRPRDLGVLLAPAGLVAWSVWLWSRFDDPFLYSTVQEAWDQPEGPRTWFKVAFGGQLLHGADAGYRASILVQALVTLIALVAVPFVARRLGAAAGVYTFLAIFLAALASKDFQGMGRYVFGAFPLFALAGILLAERPRLRVPVLAASAMLLAFGAFGFARNWYLA
jgi:hypothetical protein